MNHLKLSLRAADDPRTIKEEDGVPIFASVFALHNTTRKEREETLPITVKASHELAPTLVTELKKGVSLRRGGRVGVLQEPPNEPGVLFDLGGQFHRHHPAKIHCGEKPDDLMNKSTSVTVSLDEDAYGVFQSASEIVSRAGIRVPTGQLVQTILNAEMSRLSAREIAQRFLKSIMKHVGALPVRIPTTRKTTSSPAVPVRESSEPFSQAKQPINQRSHEANPAKNTARRTR